MSSQPSLQTEKPGTLWEVIFQSTKTGALEISANDKMNHCSPKQRPRFELLALRSCVGWLMGWANLDSHHLPSSLPEITANIGGAMGNTPLRCVVLTGYAKKPQKVAFYQRQVDGLAPYVARVTNLCANSSCLSGASSTPVVICNSNSRCLRGSVYFLLSAGRDSLAQHFIKADFIFPFIPCDTDANGEQ